jgi:hypothetical protein
MAGQHELGDREDRHQGERGESQREVGGLRVVVREGVPGGEMPHEDGASQHHCARVEHHPDELTAGLLAERQPEQGVDDHQDRRAVEDQLPIGDARQV